MTRLSEEEKQYLKYQIYRFRYDDPWISNKKVAKLLDRSISTINRYAKQAEEGGIILNPSLKLKPHPQFKAALLSFENKYRALDELKAHKEIRFICLYHGDWDFRVTYDASIDFTEIPGHIKTVADGVIGPGISPRVEYISWERCFEFMEHFLEEKEVHKSEFDHQPCVPEWDEEDWQLYYYFLPNVRKSFKELREETPISWRKYQEWKKNLTAYCTITTGFFPEGYLGYNDMTLCFQTRYEKYIAGLFSLMPTSSLFFRIGKYFLANIFIPKEYDKLPRVYDVIFQLLDRGIISDYRDGYGVIAWWNYEDALLNK